jgi:predicted Holliday junction resolvase-like endonuclease
MMPPAFQIILALLLVLAAVGTWGWIERSSRLRATARVSELESVLKKAEKSRGIERRAADARIKALREEEKAHERTKHALEEALAADAQSWGDTPVPASVKEALK